MAERMIAYCMWCGANYDMDFEPAVPDEHRTADDQPCMAVAGEWLVRIDQVPDEPKLERPKVDWVNLVAEKPI